MALRSCTVFGEEPEFLHRRVDMHDDCISGLFGGDPRAVGPDVNLIGYEQRDASIDSAIARHIGFVRRGDIRIEDVVDSNCNQIVRARLQKVGDVELEAGIAADMLPGVLAVDPNVGNIEHAFEVNGNAAAFPCGRNG